MLTMHTPHASSACWSLRGPKVHVYVESSLVHSEVEQQESGERASCSQQLPVNFLVSGEAAFLACSGLSLSCGKIVGQTAHAHVIGQFNLTGHRPSPEHVAAKSIGRCS